MRHPSLKENVAVGVLDLTASYFRAASLECQKLSVGVVTDVQKLLHKHNLRNNTSNSVWRN